jgi:hypothetical protein
MLAMLAVDDTSRLTRYGVRALLSLNMRARPSPGLIERIQQLEIWRPCQLTFVDGGFRLRPRRGNRAGRRVRQRLSQRSGAAIQQPPARPSGGYVSVGCLNIRSLHCKVDDVLELLHDRSIDVLCLAETWHDADSVCIRRLRSSGLHVSSGNVLASAHIGLLSTVRPSLTLHYVFFFLGGAHGYTPQVQSVAL